MHLEQHTELDNLITMRNLRTSANKESNDAYDVHTSLTHFAADQETIDTNFRIILSVNQLSIYGAVANMCEEFEDHQDRSGQPDVLMGQSIVLNEIKAEAPLENDIPSQQNLPRQRYEERIEMLSQEKQSE